MQERVIRLWRCISSCDDPAGRWDRRPPVERASAVVLSIRPVRQLVGHVLWWKARLVFFASMCFALFLFCCVLWGVPSHTTVAEMLHGQCLQSLLFCDFRAKCIWMRTDLKECVFLFVEAVHWDLWWIGPYSRARGGLCDAKQVGQVDSVL